MLDQRLIEEPDSEARYFFQEFFEEEASWKRRQGLKGYKPLAAPETREPLGSRLGSGLFGVRSQNERACRPRIERPPVGELPESEEVLSGLSD